MLKVLQAETFNYFLNEVNLQTGLIADKTQPGSPSSIAAVGLGLSSYVAGIERGLISRDEAVKRTLTVLRFFHSCKQGTEVDATGYKGFYYHFLDMSTGKRAWKSELSTIDTAILMAGILTVRQYLTHETKEEQEIRQLAEELYLRVDWQWALNGGETIAHGWNPESGFLLIAGIRVIMKRLFSMCLPLDRLLSQLNRQVIRNGRETFEWKKMYDMECLYGGPLFIHQMSHLWLDFKGIT